MHLNPSSACSHQVGLNRTRLSGSWVDVLSVETCPATGFASLLLEEAISSTTHKYSAWCFKKDGERAEQLQFKL